MVKQFSWDAGKKIGSFKDNGENPQKSINIKFNEFEAASMLRGLESLFKDFPVNEKTKQRGLGFFHSNRDDKTSIKLDASEYGGRKGVFFNVTRGNLKFSMPLDLGECSILAEYCRFYLNVLFDIEFEKTLSYKTSKYSDKKPHQDTEKPKSEITEKPKDKPNLLDPDSEDPADAILEEEKEDPFDNSPPF